MLGIETIKIANDVLNRIADIDTFKGLWTGLEKYTTGLNLIGDVAAYGHSFHQALGSLQGQPITVDIVLKLHAGVSPGDAGAGFRQEDHTLDIAQIDGSVRALETAAPEDIEPLLNKLLSWTGAALEARTLHPLIVIAVFTGVFLQICPFREGNQKLARILVALMLLKAGYAYAPYVPLDLPMKEHAALLFEALSHNQNSLARGRPDWSRWLECFLIILQDQKNRLEARLDSKGRDLSHLPTLSAKILALFENHSRLQMKQIIQLTNGRRATIKLRLNELVSDGLLKRHGQARSTWYSLV